MHSFVYETLNRASWNHEDDKIDTLGPFSFCLSQILRGEASNQRKDVQAIEFKKLLFKEVTKSKKGKIKKVKGRTYGTTLYRGYKMRLEELDQFKAKQNAFREDGRKELFCIQGFISTSREIEVAKGFAATNFDPKDGKILVLFRIKWSDY